MKKLIDMACPSGHVSTDVWVENANDQRDCPFCRQQMQRTWAFVKAPGVTPQGTRAELNTDRPRLNKVDVKAIAAETKAEVEQKWLRYSDDKIAEQHVSREINEKAGVADAAGNETPLPKYAPITPQNFAAVGATAA